MLWTFNEGGKSASLLSDYNDASIITNVVIGSWAWLPLLILWCIEAPIIFLYGDDALPPSDNSEYSETADHLWQMLLSWDTAITLPFDLMVVTQEPEAVEP